MLGLVQNFRIPRRLGLSLEIVRLFVRAVFTADLIEYGDFCQFGESDGVVTKGCVLIRIRLEKVR